VIDLTVKRRVGGTGLELGPLGLGVAPLGNLYARVSEADSQATLEEAWRQGITWLDAAPKYGFGLAEERVGRFLGGTLPGERPLLSTKVGRVLEPAASAPVDAQFVAPAPYRPVFDYSPQGIERSYADSLRRLGVERVEILLLHDVDRLSHAREHRELARQLLNESLPALERIKAERRVQAIGLGVCEWDIGYEILVSADIDCVLLAGRYTLLDASALTSGFLDACARRKVSVLAGGVFNSGFLAGGANYDYAAADATLIERRDRLLALCKAHRVPLPAAALQFTAAHPAITSLVVGARSAQELKDILKWCRTPIPEALWAALRQDRFIPEGAPVPDAVSKELPCA